MHVRMRMRMRMRDPGFVWQVRSILLDFDPHCHMVRHMRSRSRVAPLSELLPNPT